MTDFLDAPPAVAAALIWDRTWLALHGGEDGKAFIAALDPAPLRPAPLRISEDTPEAPLAVAARGVVAERAGEIGEAHAAYSRLAASDDRWTSLLGLMLQCWSSGEHDPLAFDRGRLLIEQTADSSLRSRLFMKLATYALDKQDVTRFEELIGAALANAPARTRLRRAISVTAATYFGRFPPPADLEADEPDPLVDYPWIDGTALEAAQAELIEIVKTRARNPWSWSIRMGRTNVDVAVSAELQATWAGALWLRDQIRKQLAAMLLTQAAPSAYDVLFGLSMWLAARGDDIVPIITATEPSFSETTADALVLPLIGVRSVPAYGETRLLETANASWDLISDATTRTVLGLVRPEPSEAPFHDAAVFWSRAALRIRDEWQVLIRDLAPHELAQVVAEISSVAVGRLEPNAARYIVETLPAADPPVGASTGSVLLWDKLGLPVPEGASVPLDVVVRIARLKPDALVEPSYTLAEEAARGSLAQTLESARRGAYGFDDSASAWISTVAIARGAIQRPSLDLLLVTAAEASIAPHVRLDAVMAIAELAARGLVPKEDLDQLRRLPELREIGPMRPTSQAAFAAARLAARGAVLMDEEQLLLFTLSRDPDPQARAIVAGATARFLELHESPAVEAALVAALFDPVPSVVNAALRALRRARLTDFSYGTVSLRIRAIFQQYGRHERAEVVRAIRQLAQESGDPEAFGDVLVAARADRSWIVRNAARDDSDVA
jgi:hypothetical protein